MRPRAPMWSELFRECADKSSSWPFRTINRSKKAICFSKSIPDDYELALEKAKSALAALDEQIEIGRSQDEELKFGVKAAEAGVAQAMAAGETS